MAGAAAGELRAFESGRAEHSPEGKLTHNIAHFGRALRRAGLPVGPGQIVDAVRAVSAAGFTGRDDFFWILQACFVLRKEHSEVFAQTFRLYWRDPSFHERMMAMLLPMVRGAQQERAAEAAAQRAADALLGDRAPPRSAADGSSSEFDIAVDASGTTASCERMRTVDFEQMTNDEMAEAAKVIARLTLDVPPCLSRRKRISARGRFPDWRATMRRAAASQGEVRDLVRRDHRLRWPSLVALCDISGSMSVYSRTILRFLHAVANRKGHGWSQVHAFTFGTRLTNITRHLRSRDADAALAAAGAESPDWDGGTRIGVCLRDFNIRWSRRVMGQGALTLLISDGLDGGRTDALGSEMRRLRLSSRRLIWINPLLRWEGFLPKAGGIREMLPHVDCFRSAHNIESLEELAAAVSRMGDSGEKKRLMAALREEPAVSPATGGG